MKKIILILFLLCAFYIRGQELRGGIITYVSSTGVASSYFKSKYKNDPEKLKQVENNPLYNNSEDVDFKLKFNKQRSFYEIVQKMSIGEEKKLNFSKIVGGGSYKYYTKIDIFNLKNETLNCVTLGECFLVEGEMPKWELKQDTKYIQGFLCYKAELRNERTGNVTTQAWYAPKLPYQYGITDYYGLPGIILEIRKNTYIITATKVVLNPIEALIVEEPPKNVKKISKKEFLKLSRRSRPGLFGKN